MTTGRSVLPCYLVVEAAGPSTPPAESLVGLVRREVVCPAGSAPRLLVDVLPYGGLADAAVRLRAAVENDVTVLLAAGSRVLRARVVLLVSGAPACPGWADRLAADLTRSVDGVTMPRAPLVAAVDDRVEHALPVLRALLADPVGG